jgi:hypothetical protein
LKEKKRKEKGIDHTAMLEGVASGVDLAGATRQCVAGILNLSVVKQSR